VRSLALHTNVLLSNSHASKRIKKRIYFFSRQHINPKKYSFSQQRTKIKNRNILQNHYKKITTILHFSQTIVIFPTYGKIFIEKTIGG